MKGVALSLFLVLPFLFFLVNLLLFVAVKKQPKLSGKFKSQTSQRGSPYPDLILVSVLLSIARSSSMTSGCRETVWSKDFGLWKQHDERARHRTSQPGFGSPAH